MAVVIYVFIERIVVSLINLESPHLTFKLHGLEAEDDSLFNKFISLSYRAHSYFHISKPPLQLSYGYRIEF